MSEEKYVGVYQLDNGYWGYRYAIVLNGKKTDKKKVRNEDGKPFKTQKQAARAKIRKVPFYCAAWSNIKTVRNVIKCDFKPAWVELTARDNENE